MWHFSLHFYVTLACLIALFYTHKTSHKLALNYEFSTKEREKDYMALMALMNTISLIYFNFGAWWKEIPEIIWNFTPKEIF